MNKILKLFSIYIFSLFICTYAFSSIITLSKCYMTKYDGEVVNNDKVWKKKNWEIQNDISQTITNYYEAKEFIPNNIGRKEFNDIMISCQFGEGCNKKAEDLIQKYNLRVNYIKYDDFKISINTDTGTIIVEEFLTDDAIKKINYLSELRWKWSGKKTQLYLMDQHLIREYIITNYTEDSFFSKKSKYIFLNVNFKKNTAEFKIDSDKYKETSNFICQNSNSMKRKDNSNSTLKSILKMLN